MGLFSNDTGKKLKEKGGNSISMSTASSGTSNDNENVNGVSLISMETTIKGTIETNSMFQLEGVLEGDIKGANLVHIGATGKVKGNIMAEVVHIDGEVNGEISAHKVEIGETGKAFATITSAIFIIQEGGVFEGTKRMKVALIKEEERKPKSENKPENKVENKTENKNEEKK